MRTTFAVMYGLIQKGELQATGSRELFTINLNNLFKYL